VIFVAKKKRMKFLSNDLQSSFPWFASVRRIRVYPRNPRLILPVRSLWEADFKQKAAMR